MAAYLAVVLRFNHVSDDKLACLLQKTILEKTKIVTKYNDKIFNYKINKNSIKTTKHALNKNRRFLISTTSTATNA